eukprot:TRINITY_DN23676_c0_g1_i1.p1 TRINITY_DN23676_c0_g1~~TRINITY_DN23676_c0_g1_i1.p1  ORF type:complete len:320 (+),score=75.73 TRINITY_DN23676_c0_g1_i1:149-1108(+)
MNEMKTTDSNNPLRISFCGAANHLTQLYMASLRQEKMAYKTGFCDALDSVLRFLADKNLMVVPSSTPMASPNANKPFQDFIYSSKIQMQQQPLSQDVDNNKMKNSNSVNPPMMQQQEDDYEEDMADSSNMSNGFSTINSNPTPNPFQMQSATTNHNSNNPSIHNTQNTNGLGQHSINGFGGSSSNGNQNQNVNADVHNEDTNPNSKNRKRRFFEFFFDSPYPNQNNQNYPNQNNPNQNNPNQNNPNQNNPNDGHAFNPFFFNGNGNPNLFMDNSTSTTSMESNYNNVGSGAMDAMCYSEKPQVWKKTRLNDPIEISNNG